MKQKEFENTAKPIFQFINSMMLNEDTMFGNVIEIAVNRYVNEIIELRLESLKDGMNGFLAKGMLRYMLFKSRDAILYHMFDITSFRSKEREEVEKIMSKVLNVDETFLHLRGW